MGAAELPVFDEIGVVDVWRVVGVPPAGPENALAETLCITFDFSAPTSQWRWTGNGVSFAAVIRLARGPIDIDEGSASRECQSLISPI